MCRGVSTLIKLKASELVDVSKNDDWSHRNAPSLRQKFVFPTKHRLLLHGWTLGLCPTRGEYSHTGHMLKCHPTQVLGQPLTCYATSSACQTSLVSLLLRGQVFNHNQANRTMSYFCSQTRLSSSMDRLLHTYIWCARENPPATMQGSAIMFVVQ